MHSSLGAKEEEGSGGDACIGTEPSSVTQVLLSPNHAAASPKLGRRHAKPAFKSPRSCASTPPSSARSRLSSAHGASPPCAAGRNGLRQRSRAYVARAQECFSRWRREKLETRAAQRKEVAEECARTRGS